MLETILSKIAEIIAGIDTAGKVSAYLFGSALRMEAIWADVDILIVCDNCSDSIFVRKQMRQVCDHLPIHLLIMTNEEEAEFDFIRSEGCYLLATNDIS